MHLITTIMNLEMLCFSGQIRYLEKISKTSGHQIRVGRAPKEALVADRILELPRTSVPDKTFL